MLQVIDKDEVAKRKPYKFSEKMTEKIRQRRKEKERKRKNMAQIIAKIDTLDEIIPEDIVCGSGLGNIMRA